MCLLFFFNDTATTEIYTLSLHDALPISWDVVAAAEPDVVIAMPCGYDAERSHAEALKYADELRRVGAGQVVAVDASATFSDRKSTRLNSSHANISYAVFCLKKKNYKLLR